jgi:hypothetical protein
MFRLIPGHVEEINDSDLMTHGWVLQEHLLSRHSMYFGTQTHWERCESIAYEAFPSQNPTQSCETLGASTQFWTLSNIRKH